MKKMAVKRKIGLKTMGTRKKKEQLMKDRQIDDDYADQQPGLTYYFVGLVMVFGKKRISTMQKRKQHLNWAAEHHDDFLKMLILFGLVRVFCKRMASTISTKRERKHHLDWAAGLPNDLLELVVKKLPLIDCLSFSRVCKSWRSVTISFFQGSTRGIPLLVKPGQSEKKLKTCLNVLDKKTKDNNCATFDIPMSEENIGSHIWGSYRDWLILGRLHVDDNTDSYLGITLLNPFSGEKVVLPKTYDKNKYYMVVLSMVPSDPRCIYMLVGKGHYVAFWTCLGGAEEWVTCQLREWRRFFVGRPIIDALYHDRHFYVLRLNFDMIVIDEKSVIDTMLLKLDCRGPMGLIEIGTYYLELVKPSFSVEPSSSRRFISRNYIVESSGDILLMSRVFYNDGPKKCQTCAFETFRLDVSGRAWIKLETLNNNKMIILGRSSSRSFDAKEELCDDSMTNTIYFSNDSCITRLNEWGEIREALTKYILFGEVGDDVADDWDVFRLEEGHNKTTENSTSGNNNNWPHAFDAHAKLCAGIWVTAPIWWCLMQQREHQTLELNLLKHGCGFDENRVRRATRVPRRSTRLKDYITF